MKGTIYLLFIVLLVELTQASLLSLLDPLGLFSSLFWDDQHNLHKQANYDKSDTNAKQEEAKNKIGRAQIPPLGELIRSIDGSGNNENNPDYGKTGAQLVRLTAAMYADSKSAMIYRGNPRQISNTIGFIGKSQLLPQNERGLNMLYVLFGQFLDHDLDLTNTNTSQPDLIPIPKFDSSFDATGTGTCTMLFQRSKCTIRNGKRKFANQITSWLDGNNVYGSTNETLNKLRSFTQGKLILDNNLLPRDGDGKFMAGDMRVGENIGLASIHTLFVRQHNRQCDQILSEHPQLRDEQVFQIARNKVIGLLQKISFKQFLPLLLGQNAFDFYIGKYKGYDKTINPNVNIEFSTAAFRIGHPMLFSKIDIYDYENRKSSTVNLEDMFLAHQHIKKPQQIDLVLNGLMRSVSKKRNNQLVNAIRNLLVTNPGIRQDLFALNIKRGRDHGIPDYNTVRKYLGFAPIKSFAQVSQNQQTASRLQKAFKSDVNNIDFWVGIISQDSLPNAELGEVGAAIVGETFRRVRDGDRFWYEYAYPQQEVAEIEATTLCDILLRNTQLTKIPINCFKRENINQSASNIRYYKDFQNIDTGKIDTPFQSVPNPFNQNFINSIKNNMATSTPTILNQYQQNFALFGNIKKI